MSHLDAEGYYQGIGSDVDSDMEGSEAADHASEAEDDGGAVVEMVGDDHGGVTWSQLVPQVPPGTPTVTTWESSFTDVGVEIEDAILHTCLDELAERWIAYQTTHGRWGIVCAYRLFELDPDTAVCDVDEVGVVEQNTKDVCIRLYNRMERAKLIARDEPDDPNGKRLIRILHLVASSAAVIVANHTRFEHSMANHLETGNSNCIHAWEARVGVRLAGDDDAINLLTTGQRLILHVLEKAFLRNLRKYQGNLYRQVLTPCPGGHGMNRTHAWEMYSEILPYIYDSVNKHRDWTIWCDLTSSRTNPMHVEAYIANSNDFELKTLDPKRWIFSFTNGVYNAQLDQMYTYEQGIPTQYVAAKFFNVAMPVEYLDEPDFRDIPTPALDGILSHQQFSTEPYVPPRFRDAEDDYDGYSVRDWIYVFMGRMIYAIGEHDTWQALMFLKGKAGTGKSTLGKVLSNLYDAVDVGVLSNNIEHKFGLSAIADKLIYICYEVKKDFGLDQGEMQSMISGEPISISTKNKTAKSISWNSHGFFMGNEFPNWSNNSGSIGRRIITALFDHVVTESNPKLFDELQEEMGRIIVKINRAYRQCASMYGGEDIWKLLPPYFEETRERELEAHTHALSAFMVYLRYDDHGRTLQFSPEGSMPFVRFRTLASDFINENTSTRKINWNAEFYSTVFPRYGLNVDDGTLLGICEAQHA